MGLLSCVQMEGQAAHRGAANVKRRKARSSTMPLPKPVRCI
jgi:hypothetical protein